MRYKISFILIALILFLALPGCSNGIKEDEAKIYVDGFFEAIVSEDYSKAEEFLHPDRPASIADFIMALEMGLGLDFQAGMEIAEYTSVSTVLYDSTVAGATYKLCMDVMVGDVLVDIELELVRNDAGFGIYNFNFTPIQ